MFTRPSRVDDPVSRLASVLQTDAALDVVSVLEFAERVANGSSAKSRLGNEFVLGHRPLVFEDFVDEFRARGEVGQRGVGLVGVGIGFEIGLGSGIGCAHTFDRYLAVFP